MQKTAIADLWHQLASLHGLFALLRILLVLLLFIFCLSQLFLFIGQFDVSSAQ